MLFVFLRCCFFRFCVVGCNQVKGSAFTIFQRKFIGAPNQKTTNINSVL